MTQEQTQLATIAGGCFWCTEAMFKRLRGVIKVVSGYAGGNIENPTYEQIHTGQTGHAEAIQVEFDPKRISYEQLIEVFFGTHDPTTPNRQGNDIGEEYRSMIFYHTDEQRQAAERVKRRLEKEHVFSQPIVTQIVPASEFYPAEEMYQDCYDRDSEHPYCQAIINPKLATLRLNFEQYLKNTE